MKERTVKSCWHRILAVLLAISMVLIPVHFPGHVHAENVTLEKHPALFKDAFADSNKVNGVTYKWNMSHPTWTRADGVLTENTNGSGSYNRWALVSATTADGATDLAAAWQDYTVETKFTKKIYSWTEYDKDDNPVEKSNVHTVKLMANVQEDARFFYVLEITGKATDTTGTLALRKAWLDETYKKNGVATPTVVETLLASKGDNVMTPGTQHTMALKVENVMLEGDKPGVKLTAIYDGAEIFTVTDSADFEHSVTGQTGENSVKLDTEKKKCSVLYTAGTAGLRVAPQQGITQFDDFNVTSNDGAVLFADDFSDDRYIDGATAKWEIGAPNYDVNYTWHETLYTKSSNPSVNAESSIVEDNENSFYRIISNALGDNSSSKPSCLYLSGIVEELNNLDVGTKWTDYTVEFDIRMNETSDTVSWTDKPAAYLLTHVQDVDNDNVIEKTDKFYKWSLRTNGVRVFKGTNNSEVFIDAGGGVKKDQWCRVKMVYDGNKLGFYIYSLVDGVVGDTLIPKPSKTLTAPLTYDEEGQGYIWTEETMHSEFGGIALWVDTLYTNESYSVDFDNIKVTLADGTEAFYEGFDRETTGDYFADSVLMEDAFRANVYKDWSVTDGAYGSTGTDASFSYVTMKSSDADLAQAWTDYIVKADMSLDATDGVGSLIARYSDAGYYEMRVNANGTVGLYRSGVAEALATGTFNETVANAQLEVCGTKLIGSINGTKVVERDTAEDDVKLTAGTAGVTSGNKVAYDNFSVTTHDWAAELTNDGTNHYYTCSGCESRKDEAACSGGSATCKDKAICDYCKKAYGDVAEHKFVDYVSDGNATYNNDGTKSAFCEYGCGEKDTIADEGSMKTGAVAQVGETKYGTLADALAAGDEIKLIADVTETEFVNATGKTIDLNGFTLTADILATIKVNGGTFKTSKYTMVSGTAGYYISTDAVFTISGANLDTTVHSGTLTLGNPDGWTNAGQKLVIEEDATFKIPANYKLNVQSTVTVEGTVVVDGTVILYNKDATIEVADNSLNVVVNPSAGDTVLYEGGKYIVHSHTGGTADCQNKAICGTCGQPYGDLSTEHKWPDTYTSENDQHWKECTVDGCAATTTKTNCTGGDAKCNAKAICEYCNQPYGNYDEDDHAAEAEWVKTPATHEMKYYDCCGATVTAEAGHSWVNGKCSVCEYECQHPLGTDATCIAKAVCDECGMQYGDLDPDNHGDQGPVWDRTATTHKLWYKNCCEVIEVAEEPHEWENGMCTECTMICEHTGGTANCQSGKVCEICEMEYTDKNTTVHTVEAKWFKTEETHIKLHTCCNTIVVEEAEHTLVHGVCSVCQYGCTHTGGEATCNKKAVCTTCGEEYGNVDLTKHTKGAVWTKTADKHSKAYECCGTVVVAEAAHSGGTATCKDKAICSVCGEAYGELAAHKGGTATCKDKAKCTVCGESYGELAEHKGGEATCIEKAQCSVCGKQYGELNAAKHDGEAKWTKTADKHTKTYDCCGEVVVAEEAHKLTDGKCECGYEAPAPVEPGEIENATDADKNACGGTLDVKDEHLSDKLLTEEEKETVKGGADIEISLKIEDISDKVSTADKAAVENKLGDMKVGMYLNIDLEKKVGDKAPVKITKTNGGVTVTITVPAELINTDAKIIRTYKVIRVHEGVADILDAIFDAKTGKLSFETDKFSTYTLVYSDAPSSDNSNTGDNTMIVLFGGLLALSALAAGVIMTPDIRKKLMGK